MSRQAGSGARRADRDQGRLRRVGSAAIAAAIDAALLVAGLSLGWFSAGEILVGAWLQTAVPLVGLPVLLFLAAAQAPDHPSVDAGDPIEFNGRPIRGRRAARLLGGFFIVHYGMFILVLGGFVITFAARAGYAAGLTTGLALLALRAIPMNLPILMADARYLATDGYACLADKAGAVAGRIYLRMVPLHIGLIVVIAPASELPEVRLDLGIVGVLVAMTFVGALWRYPVTEVPEEVRLDGATTTPPTAIGADVPVTPPPIPGDPAGLLLPGEAPPPDPPPPPSTPPVPPPHPAVN